MALCKTHVEVPPKSMIFFSWTLKKDLETGAPPGNINNGPGELPRTAKYNLMALTGHKAESACAGTDKVTGLPL